jgi:hypothetical protein
MTIKTKIYGDVVTITDGVATSKNKFLEEICNFIGKTIGFNGSPSEGYLPKLGEIFGKNFVVTEVIGEPKDAIY